MKKAFRWSPSTYIVYVLAFASISAAQAQTKEFNVPAQLAITGIPEFARQAEIQILVSEPLVRGKRIAAVVGSYTVPDALTILLKGTGLVATTKDGATYTLDIRQNPGSADVNGSSSENGGTGAADAENSDTELAEVVVTANKRPESILNVAGSVSVISAALLDQIASVKLSDYAAFVPGLQVMPSQNPGLQMIVLRGIPPLTGAATAATYIDDVPVGSASSYENGGDVAIDIDPAELQRVEVLQGPQGTLYGGSALGGVVKYVTRQPDLTQAWGRVSAESFAVDGGGIGDEFRAAGSVPLIEDELAISISGHYRKNPGYIDGVGNFAGNDVNEGDTEGGRVSLLYAPAPDWTVNVGALLNRISSNADNTVLINPITRQPIYGEYTTMHVTPTDAYTNLNLYTATVNHAFQAGPTLTSATSYSDQSTLSSADASFGFIHTLLGLQPDQGVNARFQPKVSSVTSVGGISRKCHRSESCGRQTGTQIPS
jgi:outer membrane receptor protein involved in Fe transport